MYNESFADMLLNERKLSEKMKYCYILKRNTIAFLTIQ